MSTEQKVDQEIDAMMASMQMTHGAVSIKPFRISEKVPGTMTAGQINKELDKLADQDSTLTDLMIAQGRGHERPSEYLKKTDPLSVELRKNSDRRQRLRIEIELRFGPNPPSRLPLGKFYGPRSSSK